ncbi:efflux RND transporter periplasmic adaptor subunit [Pauljensenia sp. UMB1235]|uniref:efflux RND transporter periplasmic adaptor subunit n=1 Tax=unclassified Pauljensenia TaxID=2908895 RepID=UPI00254D35F9|nr:MULTISPECIES: efflux RND transporter periplasmic adaptor subunit [unclassified Pauljensenia]MDK6400976.1 efflux RND transporter periplasmic adaptor subunit [Pauljensenia sp. UMB9872]MDK7173516.1 efflux RND transporter periplasmic adaptor subunit [Pauljensenia sp. UMB1235]
MSSSTSPRFQKIIALIKTGVWIIIAISLVKFAFFPSTGADQSDQPLDPNANYGQMTVSPTKADITNTVSVNGNIENDPSTVVKATGAGTVNYIAVSDGTYVEAGAMILQVRKVNDSDNSLTTGDEEIRPTPTYTYTDITAPASGTLHLSALLGQEFSIGDQLGTIAPSTYSAVATLNADQLYRIQETPSEATVTITNGPAPFTCSGLKIVTPDTTQKNTNQQGENQQSTGIQARCAIPADQKVFPGLGLKMDIVAGSATDVLTLPVSAVEGRFQSGFVYIPATDGAGKPEKKPVTLGLTDGEIVEIKEGLTESDSVLEFIPTASSDATRGSESGVDGATPLTVTTESSAG